MKRVLCISDSLGLPRPQVPYTDTWFSMLRRLVPDHEFISVFRRNATTEILSSNGDYGDTLLFYQPQIIIIQLGICDCAPRYFRTTSLIYRLLNKFPHGLSSVLWKIIKLLRKRDLKHSDVSIDKFHKNWMDYIEQCVKSGVENIIIIKIATPGKAMIIENPQILMAIERYNKVYEQLAKHFSSFVTLINPLALGIDSYYVLDGYHPNGFGNGIIANSLIEIFINDGKF